MQPDTFIFFVRTQATIGFVQGGEKKDWLEETDQLLLRICYKSLYPGEATSTAFLSYCWSEMCRLLNSHDFFFQKVLPVLPKGGPKHLCFLEIWIKFCNIFFMFTESVFYPSEG